MLEDRVGGPSPAPPAEGENRGIPPVIVMTVVIAAMLIVAALGISIIKVDQTAMHRIVWNEGDVLSYSGTSVVGNDTNEVSIICDGASTDLNAPGFGTQLTWGMLGPSVILTQKLPLPYDFRDNRGNIVGQRQIATAFGDKWVDVWATYATCDNGAVWQMAVITASIGHNTGLVYEASMMADGVQVHISISNSTNAELWRADLEHRDTIQCAGGRVTEDVGYSFGSVVVESFGPIAIEEGDALRYEIQGNSTYMKILSAQDLFGIAAGDFSFNQTLSSLSGRSGTVNAFPPAGIYYMYLDIRMHGEGDHVSMYWNWDDLR
jgi:hypothetical protein